MKGDKAAGAAKNRPEWRSCRETNEGRGSQEEARMETNEGRQMKAAGAAKSRPQWRAQRETNEGRSGQEQARMEITQGDK